jgi:ferredoxin
MWNWLWKGRQTKQLSLQDQDALPAALVRVEGFSDQSWQGERSLLDALDRANVPVRSSCRSGNCGACLAYLKAGKVAYTKEVTFPLEVGEILMCSCVPLSALTICLPDKPVGTDRRR